MMRRLLFTALCFSAPAAASAQVSSARLCSLDCTCVVSHACPACSCKVRHVCTLCVPCLQVANCDYTLYWSELDTLSSCTSQKVSVQSLLLSCGGCGRRFSRSVHHIHQQFGGSTNGTVLKFSNLDPKT